MDRVVQEAASLQKNLVIVCCQDIEDGPVKVGYFFAEKEPKHIKDSDIKWFTEDDDIRVIRTTVLVPNINQPSLKVDFTDKRKSESRFLFFIQMNKEPSIMNNVRFDIKGPGMARAVQEATSLGKKLGIVCYQDIEGCPVKVGYFFADNVLKYIKDSDVKWFTEDDDIRVISTTDTIPSISQASLKVDYTNKKESEKSFLLMIPLDGTTDLLFRNVFRVKHSHVTDFTIQVEITRVIEGKKNQPVIIVRYDCAHGSLHRDLFASNDGKIKNDLPTQKAEQAIPFALEDVKTHLNVWLPQLGYPQLPKGILESARVATELDIVKSKLLELYEHPELLNSTTCQFVQYVNAFS